MVNRHQNLSQLSNLLELLGRVLLDLTLQLIALIVNHLTSLFQMCDLVVELHAECRLLRLVQCEVFALVDQLGLFALELSLKLLL